jgi:hypothetical protein
MIGRHEISLIQTDRCGRPSFALQYEVTLRCPLCGTHQSLKGHAFPINEILYPTTHSRSWEIAIQASVTGLDRMIECGCGILFKVPRSDRDALFALAQEKCTYRWLLDSIRKHVSEEQMWRFKHLDR